MCTTLHEKQCNSSCQLLQIWQDRRKHLTRPVNCATVVNLRQTNMSFPTAARLQHWKDTRGDTTAYWRHWQTGWLVHYHPVKASLWTSLQRSFILLDVRATARPDTVIRHDSELFVLELTVCHESNLVPSRAYKLNK